MGEANSAEERYERLGLREALSRDADYAGRATSSPAPSASPTRPSPRASNPSSSTTPSSPSGSSPSKLDFSEHANRSFELFSIRTSFHFIANRKFFTRNLGLNPLAM
uniref:Uncharacterized protein n=1 Tax=Ananas comosus var. bracteatus TaxID=296719 RepID=A0A6V7PT92_ANACO|nr:unnamed protein product [Ananas comosus var. bracteatus]